MKLTNQQIDYGKLGRQRFCKFCHVIKQLIQENGLHFNLLIAAGNSGLSLAKFTELIYQELNQESPPKLQIPFFRYFPGHNDDSGKIFESKIFLSEVINQVKNSKIEIKNVLFVDDEIGLGITAISIFNLLNQALKEARKPRIENYYIVAENQGFKTPKENSSIKFIPYDFELDGYNNVIFFFNPLEFEKPIIDMFGDDDKFPFHQRTNLLLGLPIKDFNSGHPIYSDKYLKIAQERIPNFNNLQKNYLTFIKAAIKDCFKKDKIVQ